MCDESSSLTDPQVVEIGDDLLELDWDLHRDVLVEARLNGAEGRHRRPVISAS